MDPPFRPSHIDGGALHLHRRCSNNRGPQTRGSSSLCVKRNPFSHLTICEISDSRYQSIYNPTTDEWILQVLMIPTVLTTFLINYELSLKQFISPKSINFNETFSFQIKYLQKRDSGMYECQVHILQIYISKYWTLSLNISSGWCKSIQIFQSLSPSAGNSFYSDKELKLWNFWQFEHLMLSELSVN